MFGLVVLKIVADDPESRKVVGVGILCSIATFWSISSGDLIFRLSSSFSMNCLKVVMVYSLIVIESSRYS
jgi:uncharacterized membrane protein